MKRFEDATLELFSRRRFGRTNFVATLLGGSYQRRRKELGLLAKQKKLKLLPPNGGGVQERSYEKFFHRIYERVGHTQVSSQFWHQVLIDDILISIEAACKRAGLRFRDRVHILGDKPLHLPARISHMINGVLHTHDKGISPDAIFAIEDTYFVLEADRGTEPEHRPNLKDSSYLRKILQYRDVLKNKTYTAEWGIPNMVILNITTMPDRVESFKRLMQELNITSKSLCFKAYPTLAATTKAPEPLLTILTDPMQRVGHAPFIIGTEVHHGRETTAHTRTDRPQAEDRQRA